MDNEFLIQQLFSKTAVGPFCLNVLGGPQRLATKLSDSLVYSVLRQILAAKMGFRAGISFSCERGPSPPVRQLNGLALRAGPLC